MQPIAVVSYKKLSRIIYDQLYLNILDNKYQIFFITVDNIVLRKYITKQSFIKKNIKIINIKNIKNLKKVLEKIKPKFILSHIIENYNNELTKLYKIINSSKYPCIKILRNNFISKEKLGLSYLKRLISRNYFYYDIGIKQSNKSLLFFPKYSFKSLINFNHEDFFINNKNNNKNINRNNSNNKKKYCVFLDENFVDHPDIKLNKRTLFDTNRWINKKKYYYEMKNFFKFINNAYNIDVKIAAHPTVKKNNFKPFQNIKDNTSELVKNSLFVLCHQSTSINFAVLNKKKIIFIYSDEIMKTFLFSNIKKKSEFFKQQPINISKNYEENFELQYKHKLNTRAYKDYFKNYIGCFKYIYNEKKYLIKELERCLIQL